MKKVIDKLSNISGKLIFSSKFNNIFGYQTICKRVNCKISEKYYQIIVWTLAKGLDKFILFILDKYVIKKRLKLRR